MDSDTFFPKGKPVAPAPFSDLPPVAVNALCQGNALPSPGQTLGSSTDTAPEPQRL